MNSLKVFADAQRASAADALACSSEHLSRDLAHVITWNVPKKAATDAAATGNKAEFARAFAAAGHPMTPAIEMLYLAARMNYCLRSNLNEPELLRPEFDLARSRALALLADPDNCWLCDPRLHYSHRENEEDDDQSADTAPLIHCGLFGPSATDVGFDLYEDAAPDFPPALVASSEFSRALTSIVQLHVRFAGPALPDFLAQHFDPDALLDLVSGYASPDHLECMLFPASEPADAAAVVMWDRLMARCAANPALSDRASVAAKAVDMAGLLRRFMSDDRGSFESLIGKIAKINRLAGSSSDGPYGGMDRKSFWSDVATGMAAYAPHAFACLMQVAVEHHVDPDMVVTFTQEADLFAFDFSAETSDMPFVDAISKGAGASSAAMFVAMHTKAEMERRIGQSNQAPAASSTRRRRPV